MVKLRELLQLSLVLCLKPICAILRLGVSNERFKAKIVAHPLISCIVPVYNGELYLRDALDSILAQTYQPLDILVVDDGSTDRTVQLVASYGEQIRYRWQPNAGPAAARNSGLRLTQAEFVAFLDADDVWHPSKLARQMQAFIHQQTLEDASPPQSSSKS